MCLGLGLFLQLFPSHFKLFLLASEFGFLCSLALVDLLHALLLHLEVRLWPDRLNLHWLDLRSFSIDSIHLSLDGRLLSLELGLHLCLELLLLQLEGLGHLLLNLLLSTLLLLGLVLSLHELDLVDLLALHRQAKLPLGQLLLSQFNASELLLSHGCILHFLLFLLNLLLDTVKLPLLEADLFHVRELAKLACSR